MDERALLAEDVGVDQDVLHRPVLASHAGLVVAQARVAGEALEEVVDRLPVGPELGDGVADVLVPAVAQQVELGPVGPQDGAVPAQPLHPLGRVIDEVLQLLLALAQRLLRVAEVAQRRAQRLLDSLAVLDLGGQPARAPGAHPDRAGPAGGARVGGRTRGLRRAQVALARLAAELVQGGRVAVGLAFLVEAADHVGDREGHALALAQVVPQLLETDGRLLVPLAPQEVDHLAVGAHPGPPVARPAPLDGSAHHALEPLPVRHVVDHEVGQGLGRVEEAEPPARVGAVDLGPARAQAPAEALAMRLGGDDDHGLAIVQAGRKVVAHQAAQDVVRLAELDDVSWLGEPGQKIGPDIFHSRWRIAPTEV